MEKTAIPVYVTDKFTLANEFAYVTDDPDQANEVIFITEDAEEASKWIYLISRPRTGCTWVYVTNPQMLPPEIKDGIKRSDLFGKSNT